MRPIHTLYIVNHSHTDIGFTDYQDVCFRQHAEFIDQALDLIEATAHYPDGARYRWVCEVSGPLERYLRRASPAQIDRFRYWHHQGAIDVAGMQYNQTASREHGAPDIVDWGILGWASTADPMGRVAPQPGPSESEGMHEDRSGGAACS